LSRKKTVRESRMVRATSWMPVRTYGGEQAAKWCDVEVPTIRRVMVEAVEDASEGS
jgi:hypothetical protein